MKQKVGNLIDLAENGEFDIIVHGCNCFNTMGAGIAREIANRYPLVKQVDQKTIKGDISKIGTLTEANVGKFIVINAYTQFNYSSHIPKDLFEYDGFRKILSSLLEKYPNKRFGFPLIGCGLAGGDKNLILQMLKYFSKDLLKKGLGGTVTLVTLN